MSEKEEQDKFRLNKTLIKDPTDIGVTTHQGIPIPAKVESINEYIIFSKSGTIDKGIIQTFRIKYSAENLVYIAVLPLRDRLAS